MDHLLYFFHEIEPTRRPTISFKKVSALQVFEASFTDGAMPDILPPMAKLRDDSTAGRILLNSRSGKSENVNHETVVILQECPMSLDADDEVTLCGQIIRYLQPPMKIGSAVTFGELQPNSNILFRNGNLVYRKAADKKAQILCEINAFEKDGPTAAERNIKKHSDQCKLEEFTEFAEVVIIHFLSSEVLLKAMEG